jgi:SAM-dependent methyltransferase
MNAYSSLEASLHDVFWATEGPSLELPLLRDFLQYHQGRSLEIGCGSGRLLVPLIEEGFEVEGLELSAEMLDLCRKNHPNVAAVLHQGNMSEWQTDQPYDSIIIPAFTLQLSPDPPATLRHIASLLVSGGALYFSTFTPLAEIVGELPENEWYADHFSPVAEDRIATVHTRHQIDREAQVLIREHHYQILDDAGRTVAEHHSQQHIRWHTRQQWKKHLADAGFEIEKQIPDFKPKRQSLAQAQILSTIARKR